MFNMNMTVKELLDDLGIDLDEMLPAPGDKLHEFVLLPDATTDGYFLVFQGVSKEEREKYLYYMGAENEAELVLFAGDLAVYDGIDPDRLERFVEEAE